MDLSHPSVRKFVTSPEPAVASSVRTALGVSLAPYVQFRPLDGRDGRVYEVAAQLPTVKIPKHHRLVVRVVDTPSLGGEYQLWLEKRSWAGFRPVRCVSNPFDVSR
jgi:hypothetical protein